MNSSNGGVRCTTSGTQWDPPTGKMSSPTLMLQMNGVANLDPDISQVIMLEGVIGTSMTFQQETRQYTGTKCCACHEKNDPITSTHLSSIAPATQNINATSTRVAKPNESTLFARKSTWCASSERHFLSTAYRRGLETDCGRAANGCGRLPMAATRKRRWENKTPTSRPPELNENPSLGIREYDALIFTEKHMK